MIAHYWYPNKQWNAPSQNLPTLVSCTSQDKSSILSIKFKRVECSTSSCSHEISPSMPFSLWTLSQFLKTRMRLTSYTKSTARNGVLNSKCKKECLRKKSKCFWDPGRPVVHQGFAQTAWRHYLQRLLQWSFGRSFSSSVTSQLLPRLLDALYGNVTLHAPSQSKTSLRMLSHILKSPQPQNHSKPK